MITTDAWINITITTTIINLTLNKMKEKTQKKNTIQNVNINYISFPMNPHNHVMHSWFSLSFELKPS